MARLLNSTMHSSRCLALPPAARSRCLAVPAVLHASWCLGTPPEQHYAQLTVPCSASCCTLTVPWCACCAARFVGLASHRALVCLLCTLMVPRRACCAARSCLGVPAVHAHGGHAVHARGALTCLLCTLIVPWCACCARSWCACCARSWWACCAARWAWQAARSRCHGVPAVHAHGALVCPLCTHANAAYSTKGG